MAQVTHVIGIRKLPDERAVFSHDPSRAGLDTVGPVDVVGTLHTLVRSLHPRGEVRLCMSLLQNRSHFLLKTRIAKKQNQIT